VYRTIERLESRRLFATTVFTIDPALSAVTLSGDAQGFNLKRQDDGSLRARYEGLIVTDYTAGANIRFLGGSEIIAESRGRFDPGAAPGNYAAEVRELGFTAFEGVVRNLRLDLLSDPLAITGGAFSSAGEKVRVINGRFSYEARVGPDGSTDLANEEATNKTVTASTIATGTDGVTRLTIPVDVTYTYNENGANAELKLKGQIVATAGADGGLRPRIDANGSAFGTSYAGVFTTGGVPVSAAEAGDDGLRVSDFDTANLTGATVTFANRPDGAAEVLTVTTSGTPLTAAYDGATGVLTLTGSAGPAVYQQVLRTLTYANGATTPTLGDRTLRIVANDGIGDGPAAESLISVEEPFNPNVVRIGDGENRTVTFRDADGTAATIVLTGGGTATVRFTGAANQTVNRGAVVVTGADVRLSSIAATGTSPLTRLNVRTAGGNGAVDLGGATVAGPLATFGGKGVDLVGAVDVAGRLNSTSFRNISGATLTATSIGKMNVGGTVVSSTLSATDAFNPLLPGLASLVVKGAISGSRVSATGTIGSLTAGSLLNSEVYAGVVGADRFPSVAADFASEAAIQKLNLKGARGVASFDNSVIAANNLGKISLGVVDTDNGGVPFGVAADAIASIAALGTTGQKLRLTQLDDPTGLGARLTATGFTFGDFQIRLV
jgi:hypothetical protein